MISLYYINSMEQFEVKSEFENADICQALCKNGNRCSHPFRVSYNNSLYCKRHYNMVKKAEEVCCICLDGMDSGVNHKLSCGHLYHLKCLTKWCEQGKDNCPMCRTPMDTNSLIKLNSGVLNQIGTMVYSLPTEHRQLMLYNIDRTIASTLAAFFQHSATHQQQQQNVTAAVPLAAEQAVGSDTPGPQVEQVIQVYEDRDRYAPVRDPRLRPRRDSIQYNVYPMRPLVESDEE